MDNRIVQPSLSNDLWSSKGTLSNADNVKQKRHPPGVSRQDLIIDAPEILPLLDDHPDMLIYTRLSPHFRSVWIGPNCRAKDPPRAIVRPRSEQEFVAVLRLAGKLHGVPPRGEPLPFAVRGGGHDSFGRSVVANGLLVDTRALDKIQLSADKAEAAVGAGVLSGELAPFLAQHGVFTPMGYCSTVGYVGWALGGGFGVYTASYGAGAEQITGARIVTDDGRLLSLPEDDPELFWAIRGAGNGNFGIILELRIKVYSEPKILGGYVCYPNSAAEEVLGNFSEQLESKGLPHEFNGDIIFAPVLELGPVVSFMFVWTPKADHDLREGYAWLEKIKGLGPVNLNSVTETTPSGFLVTLNSTFKDFEGAPFYINNPTIAHSSREFGRIIAANPVPLNGHVVGGTHNVHGSVENENPSVALPNRRHTTITLFGAVEKDQRPEGPEMKVVREWIDKFTREVEEAGIALESGYVSFDRSNINLDIFYGPVNANRLKELKKKYDPDNLFSLAYPNLLPAQSSCPRL